MSSLGEETKSAELIKSSRLSSTILAGGISLLGSVLAFAYDSGFLSWYGVPNWVIKLDLEHVLVAVAAVGLVVMVARTALQGVPAKPWWAFLGAVWFSLFASVMIYFVISWTEWTWGPHLIVPLILLVVMGVLLLHSLLWDLLFPLVWYRSLPSWWDRWAARTVARGKSEIRTVGDVLDESFIRRWGLLVYAIAGLSPLLILGVREMGKWSARYETQFIVVERVPQCIAVRKYGDALLCIDVDTTLRRVLPAFSFIPIGTQEHMVRVSLGRLYNAREQAPTIKAFAPRPSLDSLLEKLQERWR
jgi:hypothetical protein